MTAKVEHLTPNTPYYFRVVASGEGGKGESTTETFTTLADDLAVTTGEAEVTKVSATLKGTVTPGTGPVTKCEFEYGTTKGSLTSGPLPCANPCPARARRRSRCRPKRKA